MLFQLVCENWMIGRNNCLLVISAITLSWIGLGSTTASAATGGVLGDWERMERVVAYASTGRARYPSITQTVDGGVLILFTQQTPEQIRAGSGDLLLIRSTDRGKSWSQPEVIVKGSDGEPRAIGSLTRLTSGRLIAPFAEVNASAVTRTTGFLSSDDDGRSWSVRKPQIESPLDGLAPTGRVLEQPDRTLVMSVYGGRSAAELEAGVHGCGLVRSDDGGKTWGRYTWIVEPKRPVVGAWPESRYSFEAPAVQPLADGRWVALVTAQRLGSGPGPPLILCRLWSDDAGKSWSEPDQLMPGAWGNLAQVDEHTTICSFSTVDQFGCIRMILSDDGLASFHNERAVLTFRPLGGGHLGFPSALVLDTDRVAVVIGRPRAHCTDWHGAERSIVEEGPGERIDVIFYERPASARVLGPIKDTAPPATGRWVLAERFKLPYMTMAAEMPNGDFMTQEYGDDKRPRCFLRSSDGGRTWWPIDDAKTIGNEVDHYGVVLGVLKSGRWLGAVVRHVRPEKSVRPRHVGQRGGYAVFEVGGAQHDMEALIYYSDDEGKTWQGGEQVVRKPLAWAHPYGRFLELPDGTILLTAMGVERREAVDYYGSSCVIFRSQDGGQTWGDMSVVMPGGSHPQKDEAQPNPRHNEVGVELLPDGSLLAASRTEFFAMGPCGGILPYMCRSMSTDGGRTWSPPEPKLSPTGGQGKLVAPPRGGVVFVQRTRGPRVGAYISYDKLRTFRYALGGAEQVTSAFARGNDELVVFVYRWKRETPYGVSYRWIENDP